MATETIPETRREEGIEVEIGIEIIAERGIRKESFKEIERVGGLLQGQEEGRGQGTEGQGETRTRTRNHSHSLGTALEANKFKSVVQPVACQVFLQKKAHGK